jgi:segregation and condensation protein B
VTEQPMGGGAAFWAARGVRIEPEIETEAEAGDAAEDVGVVEAEAEAEAEVKVEVEAKQAADTVDVEADESEDAAPDVVVAEVEQAAEVAEEAADEAVEVEEAADEADVEDTAEEPEDDEAEDDQVEEAAAPVQAEAAVEPLLPGFPQQRGVASLPRDEARDEPLVAEPVAADGDHSPDTAEPAWQLTGGELALPLPPLKTCVEAILMVVDEPTSVVTLAQVLERPKSEVAEALEALAEEYTVQGRGFELREVGLGGDDERTGWRIYSRAECAPVVERFVRDGQQAKLTQAALETLAVVAYRQPVSRSKVSAIRGVNCDGVMRTLLARGLVEEHGNDLDTGAVLYQTTGYFLERMGLKALDELPDLAPLLPSAADVDIEDFA